MILRINGLPISSAFGVVDSVHSTPHSGVDIALPIGTPLHSVTDGIVTKVDAVGGHDIGRMVRIEAPDGTDVIYGHLSDASVNVGDTVHFGDVIALSGNTGHSTGPHVHLQMIAENGANIDPTAFAASIAEPSKGLLDRLNDFADWFVGKEAEIIIKPATNTFMDMVHHVVEIINACSAEIITLGIVVCAGGMMIGPIVGSGGKWVGRLFIVFWGGVIWRALT